MGLPSGQDIARAMGETPLADDDLWVGKAQLDDHGKPDAKRLVDVSANFAGKAPLWYYVLAEANAQWMKAKGSKKGDAANQVPVTLGPVGGRIVAETILGLLLEDSHSFLNVHPAWQPPKAHSGVYRMGDFIKDA